MSIPDKAVEAAARAMHPSLFDPRDVTARHAESAREAVRDEARRMLEAAEPYLTAASREFSSQEPEWVNGDIVHWRARKESTESIVYVMIQGYWVDTNTGYRYPVGSLGISWSDGRLDILHKQEVKS